MSVDETMMDDEPYPKNYDGKKKTIEIHGMGVIYFKKEMSEGDNLIDPLIGNHRFIDFCILVENLTTLKIDRKISNARSLVAYGTKWEMEMIKSHPQVEHVVFEQRDVPSCIHPAVKKTSSKGPPIKPVVPSKISPVHSPKAPPKTSTSKEYNMYIKDYAIKLGLDWCLVVLSRIKLDSLKFCPVPGPKDPIFKNGAIKVYGNEHDIAKLKTHFIVEKIEP